MGDLRPKTFRMRPADVDRRWYRIDAQGQTLGKLAVKVAKLLMGKEKPTFTPGVDGGDFVIVTNASKVKVTGRKLERKAYRYHTGYVGGLRELSLAELLKRKPQRVVELAVRRMLPKTKLGKQMYGRLKVFADGDNNRHSAQKPEALTL